MKHSSDLEFDYGTGYGIQNFQYATWESVLELDTSIPSSESFTGISSIFAKMNIFLLTRQSFLQYLNFFSSYDATYKQMAGEYLKICNQIANWMKEAVPDPDSKKEPPSYTDIDAKYKEIIVNSYGLLKASKITAFIPIYLTFFKNYEYFRNYIVGYTFYVQLPEHSKGVYANIVGSKYVIDPTTPGLNCVELSDVEKIENNLRLYPLIPLDVNLEEPELELAIFGNNKWVAPIQCALPYNNPNKSIYKYSVNSIKIRSSIVDLDKPQLELDVEMSFQYFYYKKTLYPASGESLKVKVYIFQQHQDPNIAMIGVPLFNTGPEWIT